MNENVGSVIKRIAKLEWIVGICFAVLETLLYIACLVLLKKGLSSISGLMSNPYLGSPYYSPTVDLWPAYLILTIFYLLNLAYTLYTFYKKQLIVYAYGQLSADINTMKTDMVTAGTYRTMSDPENSEQLKRLQNLLNQKVITEEEFIYLKNQI